jgi:hypothetical protein
MILCFGIVHGLADGPRRCDMPLAKIGVIRREAKVQVTLGGGKK